MQFSYASRQIFETAYRIALKYGKSIYGSREIFLGIVECYPAVVEEFFKAAGILLATIVEKTNASLQDEKTRIDNEADRTIEEVVMQVASRVGHSEIEPSDILEMLLSLPRTAFADVWGKEILEDGKRIISVVRESGRYQPAAEESKVVAGKSLQMETINIPKLITPFLDSIGIDLTREAILGKLRPVSNRSKEIEEIMATLLRQYKNNPILVGKPGVGKTAIVQALALKISKGEVPARLQGSRLISLSAAALIADTKHVGELEKKFQALVDETRQAKNIILFIDEIHSLAQIGGVQGQVNPFDLLKPHLTNGDIRCIGATTWDEYRTYLEKDKALERRLQPIEISEPDVQAALDILRKISPELELHHNVSIDDEALRAAVQLSQRYLRQRYLPDKAIDILDTACARAALAALDGEKAEVNFKLISKVIGDWTGIPPVENEVAEQEKYLKLSDRLKEEILGQDEAIQRVSQRLKITKLQLDCNPQRPDGVFIFAGSSGVGKTALARALARKLYGSERFLIQVDMSEYIEATSITKLIGTAPGYVGYGQESPILAAVREYPNGILLLDKMDKAHPDILHLFLQVFEFGKLSDGQGRTYYFSDMTIIITSDVQVDLSKNSHSPIGFGTRDDHPDQNETREQMEKALSRAFSRDFLSRVDEIIIFKELELDTQKEIVRRQLMQIENKLQEESKELYFDEEVLDLLGEKCLNCGGVRNIQRMVEGLVIEPIVEEKLTGRWSLRRQVNLQTADGEILVSFA